MSRIKGPDGRFVVNPESKRSIIYKRESAKEPKLHSARELIDFVGGEGVSDYDVGSRLGIHGASVGRWKLERRYFSDAEADRWAIYLKVHPCEIWSTWWTTVELPEEELVG